MHEFLLPDYQSYVLCKITKEVAAAADKVEDYLRDLSYVVGFKWFFNLWFLDNFASRPQPAALEQSGTSNTKELENEVQPGA